MTNRFAVCVSAAALVAGAWAMFAVAFAAAPEGSEAMVSTPIPEIDGAALARGFGLIESDKPVREMIPGWKKPAKVLVVMDNNTNRLAWWQQAAPGVTLLPARTTAEAVKLAPEADAMIGSGGFCTPEVLKAAKKVKWIHFNLAGLQECIYQPELQSGKIVVSNMQRVFANAIANTVIGYTLMLTRGLDMAMIAQVKNIRGGMGGAGVVTDPMRLSEVQGQTMLVVGLGGIGTNIAKYAHGMGMRVIATRASSHEGPDYVEYVGLANELPTLIGQADVVANATPLTKDTTDLFNAAMFARMKKSAFFINVGRGRSMVQEDLEAALKNHVIAGAAIDVSYPEPLPADHSLRTAPNIIITPHMSDAGLSSGSRGPDAWAVLRENLRRYVAGEKIYNVVDVKAGY